MRIISWNVKGLGRLKKKFSIKEIFRKDKANVIKLQETKKKPFNQQAAFQDLAGVAEIETEYILLHLVQLGSS